jgi:hypothetical protein
MTTFFIVAAAVAGIYGFAAIAYYYSFKHYPM